MDDVKSGANLARSENMKAYHERRKEKKAKAAAAPQDSWYELVDARKVVKRTRTATAVHSVYHCTKKQADKEGLKYLIP